MTSAGDILPPLVREVHPLQPIAVVFGAVAFLVAVGAAVLAIGGVL